MTVIDQDILYTIKEVSDLTGVNPVTLRAWQRRYGLLTPLRTEKGHRLFRPEDIDRIHEILAWLDKGVSVGKIKPLLEQSNQSIVQEQQALEEVDEFLKHLAALNRSKAIACLAEILKEYPYSTFYEKFFLYVEKRLLQGVLPHFNLQYSLWEALLTEQCGSVIHALNRIQKDDCWVMHFGENAKSLAWVTALACANQQYRVTLLEGVQGKTAPLGKLLQEYPIKKIVLVGENKLPEETLSGLVLLKKQLNCEVELVGSIHTIHFQRFYSDEFI
ncbi:MerR family transcriptional regulator [Algicola sagamiensis]|uniref:MerR family transcriptional regulator n=1 Tax=Algicola sagamiensis TaxID=163869 RepID=UPI000360B3FA|nr:MerR family transcriptional regulator [Algicola sagamiensis]